MRLKHSFPAIERRSRILRWVRLLAGISFVLVSVTANAAPGNQGAMEKGPVAVVAVIAIGIGIVVFGGYAIWLGVIEQTEKEKAKYRRDSMAAYGFIKPPIPIYKSAITVSIGVIISLGGILFLTVAPGKVKKTPKALASQTVSVVSPTAAQPRGSDRPRVRPDTSEQVTVVPAAAPELPQSELPAIPISKVDPVKEPPRPEIVETIMAEPTKRVESSPSKTREPVDPPKPLARVTRYKIDIPLPPGASIVSPDTPLSSGMKLGAVWARKWNYVTVDEVHEDGTVDVTWDGWRTKYRMMREDLAIDKSATSPEGETARLWSDASGKFSVSATYVDFRDGYVRLRKSDGEEVSIPIAKLSRSDRILILKLAKQKSAEADGS